MPVTFATSTDTGRLRSSNEDALFARPPVFMVADGMGGPQGGEVASGITAKSFEWYMPQGETGADELTKLIQKINEKIYRRALDEGRLGMGTTVTAAVIEDGAVIFAHVGDSRAYLWRGGSLSQLTEDHSLVAEMVREGKISSAEAEAHPQRSIITRALGVESSVAVDTIRVPWEAGDIFLLCSDGLSSMVPDAGIADVMAAGDLGDRARALVSEANERGGHDNISVVLFCPDGSVPAGTAAAEADTGVIRLPDGVVAGPEGTVTRQKAEPLQAREPKKGFLQSIRRNWMFRTVPGVSIIAVLIAAILFGGAYLGTREIYFLGVDHGYVTIYRGVPYSLGPLSLFSLDWRSPVKFSDLAQDEQDEIGKQESHTRGSAQAIVDNYVAEVKANQEKAAQQTAIKGSGPAGAGATGTTGNGNFGVAP